ncbi:MAG: fibronectin type III domain-containing protein [Balneolales bacterium]|nr:fibronectin type III domain-containing protein [Balneolales bacterium]
MRRIRRTRIITSILVATAIFASAGLINANNSSTDNDNKVTQNANLNQDLVPPRPNTVEPFSFLLSWQRDPAHTMTIDWHTTGQGTPTMQYRQNNSQASWQNIIGETKPFPYTDRFIQRVEITNLLPDTEYEFRFGPDLKQYKFRTMPADNRSRPIKFVTGGDMMHNWVTMQQVNQTVAKYDIDFVAIGGDLAYADGKPDAFNRWYQYLEVWTETMIRPDGRVIPHLAGIGNHEVKRGFTSSYENTNNAFDGTHEWRLREAPYYYNLMAFPGNPGYAALDFGEYLSLIFLDTGHTNPIPGKQTEWLELALANRAAFEHVIPIYHFPGWTSVRNPESLQSQQVRKHFVPAFERYSNIRIAFENHDHAYKRTFPIRNNQISPTGIVYVGDGAWGVSLREPGAHVGTDMGWYLEKAAAQRHFILVEINGDALDLQMIDERGNIFDSLKLSNRDLVTSVPESRTPSTFILEQNYPNPFNSSSLIRFALPERTRVTLEVYTLTGRLVTTLIDREMNEGWHSANFRAENLTSGTYVYRLRAGDRVITKKMMLIK